MSTESSIMNIPNEVLLALFERLGSKETKRALSPSILALMSVCWRFRNLLLPSVFAETYSNSRLIKAALAGNTVAQRTSKLVTHFSLSGYILTNTNPFTFPVRTLSYLPNLTHLTITDLHIDDGTVLSISKLVNLESLFFNAVSFRSMSSPSTIAPLASLTLSSFFLVGKPGAISTEVFNSLTQAVVSDRLSTIQTSYLDFTRAVIRQYLDANIEIRLRSIDLNGLDLGEGDDLDLFVRFITRATDLTDVRFPTRTRGPMDQLKTLFANPRVLPRLEISESLTRWASLCVPGRPLVQLKLREAFFSDSALGTEPNDGWNLTMALGRSIGTLRRLDISPRVLDLCGKDMFDALGGLKELRLACIGSLLRGSRHDRQAFNPFILSIPTRIPANLLSTLECLVFDFTGRLIFPEVSFNLPYQHEMLKSIISLLPSTYALKQFQLATDIWWNRDDVGVWMPFIPESAYSTIKDEMTLSSVLNQMEDMNSRVTDYGGAFQALLQAEGGSGSVDAVGW